MGTLVDDVKFLNGNLIDLVEHIDAWHINPVSLNDIDKLIDGRVTSKRNISVRNLVLSTNRLDRLIGYIRKLQVH
jgi:hypothetical protein